MEQEFLIALNNEPLDVVIRRGHAAQLRLLVAKAEAGTIKHQEMAILRNMLRDNGMMLMLESGPIVEQQEAIGFAHPKALPEPDYDD